MKIQCDVCDGEEASVFCTADEAALCDRCDYRVHYANKLAGKHVRFSLHHVSFKEAPCCDRCQERRGLLFCQEHRAILCRECDIPIHKANEHTQKHNRFLLTGLKLSASSPFSYPASSSSSSDDHCNVAAESETKNTTQTSVKNPNSVSSELSSYLSIPSTYNLDHSHTSSISEYLMETLPGWSVEDFLDPSSALNGFCKNYDNLWPSSEDSIWVPQVSNKSPHVSVVPFFPKQV